MAHWHILGAGAIGCIWLHRLSRLGETVTIIVKDSTSREKYLANNGVTVSEAAKHYSYKPNIVVCSELKQPLQYLLVCTKSWQCLDALRSVQFAFSEQTEVVLLQNGFGQFIEAQSLLQQQALYAATTTDGAFLSAPYNCTIAARGDTYIGPFNAHTHTTAILPGAIYDADIQSRLWLKLCINAVINPISAIDDVTNGDIFKHSAARVTTLCAEIQAISDAEGYGFDIAAEVRRVATLTATNSSSMRQDIRHGRQTEIVEISGYLIKLAKRLGLNCPAIISSYDDVKTLSQ